MDGVSHADQVRARGTIFDAVLKGRNRHDPSCHNVLMG
jgi:hypothetical protein